MAFRASNRLPAEGYDQAKGHALGLQTRSQAWRDQLAAGPTGANVVLEIMESLKSYRAVLNEIAAIPGIAAYARAQENDETYDVVAEFQAMLATVQLAIDNVTSTFPSSTFHSIVGDVQTYQQFSVAQTANLRTRLDAIIASVE